ncbi:carbohydrate binding family 9 domain-containing protein [Teredinibacter franksiae]|uniref:carbohydrate binding family 9 domain-containing protein n=1 Tax=Teredinibacter franksiae TaxID=2761453 RepID=UPI001628B029|nr:carbohydrate binding family 9 domain-containing protein [Teredinibacter franksiae]
MKPFNTPLRTLVLAYLCLFTSNVQASKGYTLKHIPQTPNLDGIIDEGVWQQANQFELDYEYSPGPGNPAKAKTTAYIYEDGERLHIAFYAFDPNPQDIRAHLADRDEFSGDDRLGVTLDTFNGEREAYEFYVNPYGAQMEGRMEDYDGWRGSNSWNGIWYSAAKIHADGWSVEMSIPFKALRFPNSDQALTWGIAFFRAYPRELEYWLSDVPAKRSIRCNLCQFNKAVGFESVKPGQNFQLTPTVTLGKTESREDIPGEWESDGVEQSAGLDLRWGVTQNSVLNATINPDFSQVEADAAQLDVNNTYSLFLEERRPFFLDGADYFTTNRFRFVHTRNIADPDIGVKHTGKTGDHSYGLILANDNSTNFILPGNQGSDIVELTEETPTDDEAPIGSNIAIARYKKDVGERSAIGGLFTHRTADNYNNTMATVDGITWLSEYDALSYQLAYAESSNPQAVQAEYDLAAEQSDHAFAVEYIHDTPDYKIEADYRNIGKDFRADMGFVTKADIIESSIEGVLKYYGEPADFVSERYYIAKYKTIDDQNDQRIMTESKLIGEVNAGWQSNSAIGITVRDQYYENDFNPTGEHFDEQLLFAKIKVKPSSSIRLKVSSDYGDRIDYANAQIGRVLNVHTEVGMNFGKHLKIDLTHNFNTLDVDEGISDIEGIPTHFEGGILYTANQTDLRLNYQFSIRSRLKFVVQYTDVERDATLYRANYDLDEDNDIDAVNKSLSSQLIYSYKLNSQSLFYFGYSDGGYQDDDLPAIEKDYRSVFAKFSYAWQN